VLAVILGVKDGREDWKFGSGDFATSSFFSLGDCFWLVTAGGLVVKHGFGG